MAINYGTAERIIRQVGQPYYTKNGNTYMAVKVFDEKGRPHGHVIYQKLNNVEHEKPEFIYYMAEHAPTRIK